MRSEEYTKSEFVQLMVIYKTIANVYKDSILVSRQTSCDRICRFVDMGLVKIDERFTTYLSYVTLTKKGKDLLRTCEKFKEL